MAADCINNSADKFIFYPIYVCSKFKIPKQNLVLQIMW